MWLMLIWSISFGVTMPTGLIVFENQQQCNQTRESILNNTIRLPITVTDVTCQLVNIDG